MTLLAHAYPMTRVAVSRSGERAISGVREGSLRWWDVATGRAPTTMKSDSRVLFCALIADRNESITGRADGTIRAWDSTSGCERSRCAAQVRCLAVTSDGRAVVSGSVGSDNLTRWELPTGAPRGRATSPMTESLTANVRGIAIAPSGTTAIIATIAGNVSAVDLATGVVAARFADSRNANFGMSMTLGPNGKALALRAADGTVALWISMRANAPDRRAAAHLGIERRVQPRRQIARRRRERRDDEVRRVDRGNGSHTFFHDGPVFAVACAADGRSVLSGRTDSAVKRWTIDEGRTSRVLATASPFDAATLTPDGRIALHARTTGSRAVLALIDVATGIELKSIAAPAGRFSSQRRTAAARSSAATRTVSRSSTSRPAG